VQTRGAWLLEEYVGRESFGNGFRDGIAGNVQDWTWELLGDSECTQTIVGVIIGGTVAVGTCRICTGCGSMYKDLRNICDGRGGS
jgi:hypothetical protein